MQTPTTQRTQLRTRRKRPLWIDRRFNRNGMHCFVQAECSNTACSLHVAKRRWSALPAADKARWSQKARLRNMQAKALRRASIQAVRDSFQDDVGKGPWGLGNSNFVLSPKRLEAAVYGTQTNFVAKMAAKWEASGKRLRPSSKIPKEPVAPEKTCLLQGPTCRALLGEGCVARQAKIRSLLEQAVLADKSHHRQPLFRIIGGGQRDDLPVCQFFAGSCWQELLC